MPPNTRTFVCSVLFLDLAEYSQKSVSEQLALKTRFNDNLQIALEHVAVSERIVVDTGDGAAVAFLGNPEESLFSAMRFRDAVEEENRGPEHPLRVRCGINLGPVRLVKDFNGQQNIIGDGINVAQRVMSFAEPGKVLVSRSYFEVVSCLSDDYRQLFEFDGTRKDKHVREHSVYSIGPSVPGVGPASAAHGKSTGNFHLSVLDLKLNRANSAQSPKLARWRSLLADRRMSAAAGGVALLVLLGLFLGSRETSSPAPSANADMAVAAPAAAPAPASNPIPAPSKAESVQNAGKTAKPPSEVKVRLAVLPWGEVYVDGKLEGLTPPLKSFKLKPGKHIIEIRNGNAKPHIKEIDTQVDDAVLIRHQF